MCKGPVEELAWLVAEIARRSIPGKLEVTKRVKEAKSRGPWPDPGQRDAGE